jgi:hypothetical protein
MPFVVCYYLICVILQCLLDEAQEMLLIHTGRRMNVCIHLSSQTQVSYICAFFFFCGGPVVNPPNVLQHT